ncbi:MAG: type II secretion system F family protein [Caldimicrobium sp.]
MEFEYQVSDSTGKILSGTISAESPGAARELLRKKGYIVLELKEKRELTARRFSLFKRKIHEEVLYSFFRELAILLRAGITIDRAFEILITSIPHEHFQEILTNILRDLQRGKSVVEAFRKRGVFSELTLSMISAGESIGNLPQAFENIADYLKFQIQFRREIQNTLAYPIFLVIASLVTLFVIFKFILPRFFSIFGETHLPLPAKVLLSLGYLFSGKAFLFFALGLILIFILFKKGYLGFLNPYLQGVWFKIPVIRGLLLQLNLSRFSYSMHSMLKGGIEFVDALFLSKNLVNYKELREFLESSIFEIRKGRSISEVFSSSRVLPEIFSHMLKVGEETGNLKEIFLELYNIYDEKFRSSVKRLLTLLEPVIITFTGLIVGFIVISLILTVMSAGVIRL